VPEQVDALIEAGGFAVELAHVGFAAFFGSGILLAIGLSIGLETFSDDPVSAISERATRLQAQLARRGALTKVVERLSSNQHHQLSI
jgi:hypothetical protein